MCNREEIHKIVSDAEIYSIVLNAKKIVVQESEPVIEQLRI